MDNIQTLPDEDISFTLSDQLFLEVLLLEIEVKVYIIHYISKRKGGKRSSKRNKEYWRLCFQCNKEKLDNTHTHIQELENINYKELYLE